MAGTAHEKGPGAIAGALSDYPQDAIP